MREVGGGFVVYESREEERKVNRIAGLGAAAVVIVAVYFRDDLFIFLTSLF